MTDSKRKASGISHMSTDDTSNGPWRHRCASVTAALFSPQKMVDQFRRALLPTLPTERRRRTASNDAGRPTDAEDDENVQTDSTASSRHYTMSNATHTTVNDKSMSPLTRLEWVLSARERDLLRATWSDDYNFLFQLGSDIYLYIFEKEPSSKQLFPALARHGDNFRESAAFRGQSLKFVQVLASAVRNVYDLSQMDDMLYRMGALHVRLIGRGFKAAYWAVFESAITYGLQDSIRSNNTLSADEQTAAVEVWRRMAEYIVNRMAVGFNEELIGETKKNGRPVSSAK